MRGTVIFFDYGQNYGFIRRADGGPDVFVHIKADPSDGGMEPLWLGSMILPQRAALLDFADHRFDVAAGQAIGSHQNDRNRVAQEFRDRWLHRSRRLAARRRNLISILAFSWSPEKRSHVGPPLKRTSPREWKKLFSDWQERSLAHPDIQVAVGRHSHPQIVHLALTGCNRER